MVCNVCDGKGIVPADQNNFDTRDWDGSERRKRERDLDNRAKRFAEAVPAARFQSCPRCQGSGRLHLNLLAV